MAGFVNERQLSDLLKQRRLSNVAQRKVMAGISAFANAERGIKVDVPDRGGAFKMFHGQGQPIRRRLFRVEQNQVGRPLPGSEVFTGAQFEKFVGRNDQMPVGPGSKTISFIPEFSWTGTFGATKDGLPYIGSYKKLKNSYFALGFGGNGITFSLVAAEIILGELLGKKNPNASLFSFTR